MFGEDNTQKLYRKLPIYCVHDTARYNLLVFARHSNIWKCVPNDSHPPYSKHLIIKRYLHFGDKNKGPFNIDYNYVTLKFDNYNHETLKVCLLLLSPLDFWYRKAGHLSF